jgi:uncharacterized protein YxeA
MKKFTLLSTILFTLLVMSACSSDNPKSSDVEESTNYVTSDYSSNESEETWNGDQDYSSTTESYKEGSTKDHDWGEDYNSKGEYKPVEDMTQEEIKKELEEMMSNAIGIK